MVAIGKIKRIFVREMEKESSSRPMEKGSFSRPMASNEKIARLIATTIQAMKKQKEEKETRRAYTGQVTKCLRAVIDHQGEFDGTNVTKYLRIYWREVRLHDLDEKIAILKFPTLVEPEIKTRVDASVEDARKEGAWEKFAQAMKEEFHLQDADRVTQDTFLNWVAQRNKGLGPQELLKEFNKRYYQLSIADAQMIKLQRASYFLRAADMRLRDELEYHLDVIRSTRKEDVTWEEIEAAIHRVGQRRRRREMDEEVIARAPESNIEVLLAKDRKENKAPNAGKKDKTVDELSKLMEGLKILTAKMLGHGECSHGKASPSKGKLPFNCMWCDSPDHTKRECEELSTALSNKWVKFVGEVGMKKIAYYDTGESVPLNNNKGGMKVLVEKHLREKGVEMRATTFEPNVFNLTRVEEQRDLGESTKKRLAEEVRRKSGWDAPVLITSITAEVGATWEAKIEDKRKGDSQPEESQAKEKQSRVESDRRSSRRKEVHFEVQAPMDEDSTFSKDPSKDHTEKTGRKGPGWLLSREVEMELDPQEIAKKFWKQVVTGFSNEEFFGSLRRDVQDIILAKAKKKRFYKEGPHSLGLSHDDEEDTEEISSQGLEVAKEEFEEDGV
jgi:hypothetical protein